MTHFFDTLLIGSGPAGLRAAIEASRHGSIYNCVEICPKEIDITDHIAKLKRLAVRRSISGRRGERSG